MSVNYKIKVKIFIEIFPNIKLNNSMILIHHLLMIFKVDIIVEINEHHHLHAA